MVKNKKEDQVDATFNKKYMAKLPTGWSDGADSMSSDELEKVIVKSRGLIGDIEADMANDGKLATIKEDIKMINGGYKDAQSVEDAKVRYALFLLRSRGLR